MGVFNDTYPRELRKVIGHAGQFAKVLKRLEAESAAGAWVIGRSGEVRAVVSCAVADWRAGTHDDAQTRDKIVAYVDELHRCAAKTLRCGVALDCCGDHDAVTVVPEGAVSEMCAMAATTASGLHDTASTVRAGWVDGPEVLERFRAELGRVDIIARMLVRRIGETCGTLEDLQAFGREGLLDAARSFDESRGVPFARWAALRIRGAMVDRVRQWGQVPRWVWRELRAIEGADRIQHAYAEADARQPAPTPSEADARLTQRLGAIATAMAVGSLGDDRSGFVGLGLSPEELMAKAELKAQVRDIVRELPEAQRTLIEGYCFGDKTLEQAAADAGITKSWGSRLHARAIQTIADELRKRESTRETTAVSRTRLSPKA